MAPSVPGNPIPRLSKSDCYIVEVSPKPTRSGSKPDDAGAKVHPSGWIQFNVSGSSVVTESVDEHHLVQWGVKFGGIELRNWLIMWLVDARTPGATPVRIDPERKTMTAHAGELFNQLKKLRPDATRWCQMAADEDSDGDPYVAVFLSMALERRTVHRKGKKAPPEPTA